MESSGKGLFATVPDDILLLVLARLDPASLEEAGTVCRRWRDVVSNDHSWLRALRLEFGRRPFQRLQPSRMPPTQADHGWVSKDAVSATWRSEFVHRLRLHRLWASAQGGQNRKREFTPRVGTIDALVVSEQRGWALAVSMVGRAAIRSNPMTGKVFARDNNSRDIVYAPADAEAVSAVAARLDRIVWGFGSGRSGATHLTRDGAQRRRVVSGELAGQRIEAVAGAYDALAQASHEWRAVHGVGDPDDPVASAGSGGSVLVWSADTGATLAVLHGARNAPLTRVTWAGARRYVVATSDAGFVFVWDLEADAPALEDVFARAHWLRPREDEYVGCRRPAAVFPIPGYSAGAVGIVALTGDTLDGAFIIATETGGAARVSVDGTTQAAFALRRTRSAEGAAITAAVWQIDAGRQRRATRQTEPARTPSGSSLSDAGSAVLRVDPGQLQGTGQLQGAGDRAARLLLIGDATGSVWMFDGDGGGAALQRWERVHKRAVAAVAVNAALAVTAARDGQVLVLDVLSGRTLCGDRCRNGRRQAGGQLDPWFWSVHPSLRTPDVLFELNMATALAARSAAQWDAQVHNGVDTLDRSARGDDGVAGVFASLAPLGRRFPSSVTHVVAGYGWLLAANNMHIHACFAGHAHRPRARKPGRGALARGTGIGELLAEGIEEVRLESTHGREQRMRRHETREYVEREFERPAAELGLSPDEQIAYALWLSSTQASGSDSPVTADAGPQRVGSDSPVTASPKRSGSRSPSNASPEPSAVAVDEMSEAEQVAYALFLSRSTA
ncbi:hypothetical protein GGF43_002403 [Coemansia sp. RSA 2618]|nr:hypothetical protein GGF43_002403 [Coemansia sp. RSA 2618]